jgi:TRAP transporter TAXI family solute receptor
MQAPLAKAYPGVYVEASIPRATYGTAADVATVAVPNLIVAGASLPEQLGYDLTRLIFEYQAELAEVHPEGNNISLAAGAMTQPLPLHPGAQRYYDTRS